MSSLFRFINPFGGFPRWVKTLNSWVLLDAEELKWVSQFKTYEEFQDYAVSKAGGFIIAANRKITLKEMVSLLIKKQKDNNMSLLDFVADRFDVPKSHSIYRGSSEFVYVLTSVKFSCDNVVASYGDGNEVNFEVVVRGSHA